MFATKIYQEVKFLAQSCRYILPVNMLTYDTFLDIFHWILSRSKIVTAINENDIFLLTVRSFHSNNNVTPKWNSWICAFVVPIDTFLY